MNLELSEQQASIRDTVRTFARQEVAPHAAEWDAKHAFPQHLVPRLRDLGLLGIRIPDAYGGAGLDVLAYAIIVEELARVDGSLALTVASHNGLASSHLLNFGHEDLKARFLPKLASGEWLGAWALTEAGSGSDAAGMRSTAVREGDNWRLNGSKMFITQGTVGGLCVFLALTSPKKRQRGITAFAVPTDTPGFRATALLNKLGCRSSDTAEIVCEDVLVPDAQRIGEVDQGFIDTLQILDGGRVSIAAMALGLGEGALGEALSYAQQRHQFGQPLANFQAIQWMIADSRAELDAARILTWRAAVKADRGERYTREASMAKLYASEAATRACDRALQIHGASGYTRELPLERHLRDAKLCEIGEGTSEVQRLVIARQLLG